MGQGKTQVAEIAKSNREWPGERKIPSRQAGFARSAGRKLSHGAYIFQRLFSGGLFFGGTYLRREICVFKSIALDLPFLLCSTLYLTV